jgi:hypothetical protein
LGLLPRWGFHVRAVDEGDAVVVDGVPCVVVGAEGVALFVVGGVGEQGASLAGVLLDLVPERVADAGSRVAHEHACGDLQEPAGEEATESCGAVGEDDDGHQATCS